ncbi:hypothetical protein ACQY0O_003234 [Thecaphora frezii]
MATVVAVASFVVSTAWGSFGTAQMDDGLASTPRPAQPRLTTELDTLAEARRTILANLYGANRSLVRAACFECNNAQLDLVRASQRVALCQQMLDAVELECDSVAAEPEAWP